MPRNPESPWKIFLKEQIGYRASSPSSAKGKERAQLGVCNSFWGQKKKPKHFNWDNIAWHTVGFCSVSAAGEMMNKAPPYLIPAQPSLAHRQCVGMGKMYSILWDGNLPRDCWGMAEPGAVWAFHSYQVTCWKVNAYLKVRTFVMVWLDTAPGMEVVVFSMLFFAAGSDTSKSPSAQMPRSPHRAEAWRAHFLARLCFCWQFHWEHVPPWGELAPTGSSNIRHQQRPQL